MDLPDDDTEPDEYGNEPRKCVVCDLDPPENGCVKTTNRALFGVGQKLWIDPVCNAHDDSDPETKVTSLVEYAGIQFLAEGIAVGVLTEEEAKQHLPKEDHTELETRLEKATDALK